MKHCAERQGKPALALLLTLVLASCGSGEEHE